MYKTKYRTHICNELNKNHIGENVILTGWVDRIRKFGKLVFINLRDRYGITQIVCNDKLVGNIKKEFVIQVEGKVKNRKEGEINESLTTGEIEIEATKIKILSSSEPMPIDLDNIKTVTEDNRLKYRYLDLRRKDMQNNLFIRYKITKIARDFFEKNGFIEIETPFLAKSTPEGARDYVVPSRIHNGKFYALPQSPQLFKQLLMIAGFDRYMQIAKCFRDEDLRADRQPEFTQIDIEMSFVQMEDILQINEAFIKELFNKILNIKFNKPFPRLTYKEAMEKYGSDKPDIRFELELIDFDELKKSDFKIFANAKRIKGIFIEENFSNKQVKKFEELVKVYKAKGLITIKIDKKLEGNIIKFLNDKNKELIKSKIHNKKGTLFIVADEENIVLEALGRLRLKLGEQFNLYDEKSFGVVWITDFPLFEWSEEEQRFVSMHHPFTMPHPDDLKYLENGELDKVRSLAYDLAINGNEAGGGSIRIHNRELQKKIFSILGIKDKDAETKFGFLLNAFKYGVPPHGGIAFGLDRLAALFTYNKSIKEVIAFPKNKAAINPMDSSPSEISKEQLNELGIEVKKQKK